MSELYEFGPFFVDGDRRALLRDRTVVAVSNKAFEVLLVLIRDRHRVVEKEELLERVWPDTVVEENNLTVAISGLRKALGEDISDRRYIITVPGRGYRFAADVRVVAQRDDESDQASEGARKVTPRGRLGGVVATTAALLTLAGILAYWRVSSPPAPRILNYTQITNDGADKITILTVGSISPPIVSDGPRIYFTEQHNGANAVIAQVSATGGAAVVVPTPFPNVAVNGISPSGSDLLVYTWRTNELLTPLWVIPVLGGSPRRVGETTQDATWSADGQIVYASGHDLYVSKSDGTGAHKLATVTGLPVWPRWSPSGKVLRFTQHDPKNDSSSLWEVSTDGSRLHPLLPAWNMHAAECCGNWTPDGRYFVFQSTRNGRADLWALPEPSGWWRAPNNQPVQLTAGPMSLSLPLPSKDGKKLFALGDKKGGELVRYDPKSGQFVPYLGGTPALDVVFSREGDSVAYVTFPEGDLWRSKVDGSQKLQLTFPPMEVHVPRWSPDGKQIVFMGRNSGEPWRILRIPLEGGREPESVLAGDDSQAAPDWSPDGGSLVFAGLPEELSADSRATAVHILDLKSHAVSTVSGSEGLYCPRWSPSGRFISATTADGSRLMLFDSSLQRWTELTNLSEGCPAWGRSDEYLYFQSFDVATPEFVRVRVSNGKRERLASIDFRRAGQRDWYWWNGLTPDGSPLLVRDHSTEEIYALDWNLP